MVKKIQTPKGYEPSEERKRSVSVVVYDLQGGPIHPEVVQYLEDAAFNAANLKDGLAYTVVIE